MCEKNDILPSVVKKRLKNMRPRKWKEGSKTVRQALEVRIKRNILNHVLGLESGNNGF